MADIWFIGQNLLIAHHGPVPAYSWKLVKYSYYLYVLGVSMIKSLADISMLGKLKMSVL